MSELLEGPLIMDLKNIGRGRARWGPVLNFEKTGGLLPRP